MDTISISRKGCMYVLLIMAGMFMFSAVFAQGTAEEPLDNPVKYVDTGNPDYDDLVYKRELIKYLRHAEGFPEYEDKGDDYESALQFNQALKVWYQRNPEYLSILELKTHKELKKYDVSCYPDPPDYSKSESEKAYRDAFRQWMAHHPEAPKLLGDDPASKEKFEREKAEFYELYFKK